MRYILLLLLAVQLQGCVMKPHVADNGGLPTYDGVSDAYPGDISSLATMAADELAHRYPPGRTVLTVARMKTNFGSDLDSALREHGFMVAPPESPAGIRIGYILDVIHDQTPPACYLQVRTSDGETFGTLRSLSMAGAPQQDDRALREPTEASSLESLPLRDEPTIPEPSQAQAHPDRLAAGSGPGAKPAPEPVAPPAHNGGVPVRSKSTAARIAMRNKVPVADFCRWNCVKPDTVLEAGRRVLLCGPAAEPASPPTAQAVLSAPSRVHPAQPLPSATLTSAPVQSPAPTPGPAATPAGPSASAAICVAPAPVMKGNPGPSPTSAASAAPGSPVQEALAELVPATGTLDAVSPSAPTPSWSIQPGSLHAQLDSWAIKAQYQLIWKAKHDFELEAKASFDGDFLEAIKQLFSGLHRGGNSLRVTVYQGNNVIEVAED